MNDGYRVDQDQPDTNDLEAARQAIRDGANRLHAKAAFHKAPTLTNTETTAIARAKLDGRTTP